MPQNVGSWVEPRIVSIIDPAGESAFTPWKQFLLPSSTWQKCSRCLATFYYWIAYQEGKRTNGANSHDSFLSQVQTVMSNWTIFPFFKCKLFYLRNDCPVRRKKILRWNIFPPNPTEGQWLSLALINIKIYFSLTLAVFLKHLMRC